MRWCNEQINEYDIQAKTYPTICTHHKPHNNDENRFPVFPESMISVFYQKCTVSGAYEHVGNNVWGGVTNCFCAWNNVVLTCMTCPQVRSNEWNKHQSNTRMCGGAFVATVRKLFNCSFIDIITNNKTIFKHQYLTYQISFSVIFTAGRVQNINLKHVWFTMITLKCCNATLYISDNIN